MTELERCFEFVSDTSNKFWNVEVDGSEYMANWGRIGTSGQTQTKQFASEWQAEELARKKISEKIRKGYKEVNCY